MTTSPDVETTSRLRPRTARRAPRGWAAAGIAAGALGVVGIQASASIGVAYDPATAGHADAIARGLGGFVPNLLTMHTAVMLVTVLLVPFAAGLHRRLAADLPPGSLHAPVAAIGLLLVSVASMLGAGLDTEFLFASAMPDQVVAESVAFFTHWIATIPWLWVGAGLSGVAVAVASLHHGATARWIGWVSAVFGVVTLLVGISPLQYLAGFTGPVWVLVVAIGFALEKRTA
ncbi:hypothetical protein [Pseudonocardia sp.]|uniref:hypothetical protein n=1 Tax=Pseudonocardia sp. TaxID=60912 RepID=UPI003D098300